MTKTIYIIRHAQTDYNLKGIIQGSGIDSNINQWGQYQAKSFFDKYQHIEFDAIFTSALKRTHQTVDPFIQRNRTLWKQFPELNEINWGIHEGKKGEMWMVDDYKRIVNDWNSGQYDTKIEEGESARELGSRLETFVSYLKEIERSKILVCSHGRTLCALMCLLKELPLSEMSQFKHKNTALYLANFTDGKFSFSLESDRSHWEAVKEQYKNHQLR